MTNIVDKQTLISVFGEQVVAEPTPQIQLSNKYSIDPSNRDDLEIFSATGGTADSDDNLFRCQSGTSLGGYAVIRSLETAIYREGQGHECRVTSSFTTGVALSLQFAGMFSLTETCAFGYDGADFSIIHEYDGKAEVQDIQVTTAASSAANCTVTLDGDAVVIALSTGTVQVNAEEIRAGLAADGTTGAKWRFEQVDDTVYAISQSVGNKTGTMSYAAGTTGSAATITEDTAGSAKSSGNVAQASWNRTTTPFAGFDPTKLNLYRIEYGYLGAVSIAYSIYNPTTQSWVLVHVIEWANNNTTPVFGNPDFKVGWTAASLGATGTNLTVKGASAYVGVDGKEVIRPNSYAQDHSKSSISTTATNLITIRNRIVFGNRFNLGKIFPSTVSVENDHNKGAIVEILKDATLAGSTDYTYENEYNSIGMYDTAGTTVTGGDLIASFVVPATLSDDFDLAALNIVLYPEETLTISVRTISGTGATITGAINWKEER
jgi:hypothetical protein